MRKSVEHLLAFSINQTCPVSQIQGVGSMNNIRDAFLPLHCLIKMIMPIVYVRSFSADSQESCRRHARYLNRIIPGNLVGSVRTQ